VNGARTHNVSGDMAMTSLKHSTENGLI
jgi:hypothetical protein